jgi:tetratricopeptide (TPR) repeat protein
MIRRDYIVRMIEEFAQALARIRALKNERRHGEASILTEEEFKRITSIDSEGLLKLSETELIARLIETDALHGVREKMFFLTTLLKEAGDIAAAEGRSDDSRACYLKGLHLLLDSLARGDDFEQPEFVPKVELFVNALDEISPQTCALLMQHYERTGQFAKAEDALFTILDSDVNNDYALNFGIAYYERLLGHTDTELAGGNLPRAEVEAGLQELRGKRAEAGKA